MFIIDNNKYYCVSKYLYCAQKIENFCFEDFLIFGKYHLSIIYFQIHVKLAFIWTRVLCEIWKKQLHFQLFYTRLFKIYRCVLIYTILLSLVSGKEEHNIL